MGRDYQAVCPDMVPPPDRKPETVNDRALLVWSPTKEITDTKRESWKRLVGVVRCGGSNEKSRIVKETEPTKCDVATAPLLRMCGPVTARPHIVL